MPLFAIQDGKARKLDFKSVENDPGLQQFIESNCKEVLGVKYIATDFPTDDRRGDAIDTLGLDENGCPTIILYKKSDNDNIVSKALYYMDWLDSNREIYEETARAKLGRNVLISWTSPKVILIADNYNKFDKYAVKRLGENIILYKYYWYESNMLYLENILMSSRAASSGLRVIEGGRSLAEPPQYTLEYHLSKGTEATNAIFKELRRLILTTDDDISERFTEEYVAYYTTRNFAEVKITKTCVMLYLFPASRLHDPSGKVEDVPENFDYPLKKRIRLENLDDVKYAGYIARQSYIATL
ncbi:MAG TPA: DUF5655 domain-containing protein [Candidatus Atribacteria bacterium]|nr:DUF5655 domain-containing protein [Candidatus Atribacteria bacterium]HPT78964.1 DUF5655 domain-containing protein [Candidatus Atribacteria bacterium]